MKRITFSACLISAFYFGQTTEGVKKDSVQSIGEVIINAEKKLDVNYLKIKGVEAPMTINTLDNKLIEAMNINNMEEAVRNIPGIHSINQYGAFQFFNVRGFDDFVVLNDGIRDERHNITQSAPNTNFANVERIEVLKGPSGDIFGHSALGGVINIVRKKPTQTFKGNTALTVGSYNTYNFMIGAGGPISQKLRYRIDAGVNKTDGWRGVKQNTNNFAATLQYLITKNTQLELYIQHNNDKYGADTGVPTDNYGNIIAGVDKKQNYANPYDYIKNKKTELQLKLTHQFSNQSKLTNILAYHHDDIDYMVDEVLFYNPNNQTMSLYNGAYHFNHITKPISNNLSYLFDFNTLGIKHQMLVGNHISYLDRKTINRNIEYGTQANNIPVNNYLILGDRTPTNPTRTRKIEELVIGTYLHDWVTFSPKIKMLIGLRYDSFNGKYTDTRHASNNTTIHNDTFNNISYRGAVTYQPVQDLMSVYASFSSFFKPTRSRNHRTNEQFLPQRGFQTEAGIKMNKKNIFNANITGFFIEKNNVIVGHNILSQVGGAHSKGIEIDTDWSIAKQIYLKAGYTFTESKFISKGQSDQNQEIIGNYTPWTPKHTANIWLNYEPTEKIRGLGIGVGAYYADKAYQNQFNTQHISAYTLLNGTIYFQTKNNMR